MVGQMTTLKCGQDNLDLRQVQVMGILNVTPDSFSDGGQFYQLEQLHVDAVIRQAESMLSAGASILDIGGESTRPGATPVTVQQEMDRVLPVVERLKSEFDCLISVDTSTPEVMKESIAMGVGLINDVRALGRDGALDVVAESDVGLCLMHMQGSPGTMQNRPHYDNVCDEVISFLEARVQACEAVGIEMNRICLDPGYGFGKTLEHNLQLLNRLEQMNLRGLPWLVGTSRKSMIGQVLNKEADQRLYGSLATVAVAVMKGAKIIRVHDVEATFDVVRMTEAVIHEKELASD